VNEYRAMIKVHDHFDPILLGEVKFGVLFGIVLQIVTAHLLANSILHTCSLRAALPHKALGNLCKWDNQNSESTVFPQSRHLGIFALIAITPSRAHH
jgi:hypothetical protein